MTLTVAYYVELTWSPAVSGHNHSDTALETLLKLAKTVIEKCIVQVFYMIIINKVYSYIHNISNCMCLT